MNVLIVDQSTTVCRMIRNVLQPAGIPDLYEVTSGSQAVQLATANGISVIVTGADLEDMSGLELTRMLRETREHEHTQVVLFSSKGTPEDVLDAVNAGVNFYVIVPFDHALLVQKVKMAIDRARKREAQNREKAASSGKGYKRRQVL
jgi:two-component system chemotaxis response regulator CheY